MPAPIKRFFISYTFASDGSELLTDVGIPAISAGYEIANETNNYTVIDRNAVSRSYLKGQIDALRRQASGDIFDVTGDKISGLTGDIVTGEFWK